MTHTRLHFRALAAVLCVSSLLSGGCVYTAVTTKDGVKLTRLSVFGDQKIGKVDLQKGTMEGYSSEQAQVVGAMAEGFARGSAK